MITVDWVPGLVIAHEKDANEIYRITWADWLDGETIATQSIINNHNLTVELYLLGSTYVDFRVRDAASTGMFPVTFRVVSDPKGRIKDKTISFAVGQE